MAYSPHFRFVMGGELDPSGSGAWDEEWQCTVNLTFFTDPDEDTWLASRAPDIGGWFSNSAVYMHHLSRMSWAKLNKIAADGTYDDPTTSHTFFLTTPAVGNANTTGMLTLNESIVWSWTTALERGPGSKGRIYPPVGPERNSAGAQIVSSTVQGNMNAAAKGLLTKLATTVSGSTAIPVVASKVNATNIPITGVRCGRVIDVQRRRRNKVAEEYVASAWP